MKKNEQINISCEIMDFWLENYKNIRDHNKYWVVEMAFKAGHDAGVRSITEAQQEAEAAIKLIREACKSPVTCYCYQFIKGVGPAGDAIPLNACIDVPMVQRMVCANCGRPMLEVLKEQRAKKDAVKKTNSIESSCVQMQRRTKSRRQPKPQRRL